MWSKAALSLLLLTVTSVQAIWPIPTSVSTGNSTLWIGDVVLVTYNGEPGGVARTAKNILDNNFVPWKLYPRMALEKTEPSLWQHKTYITRLEIVQTKKDTAKTFKPLAGEVDESYELTLNANGKAKITAVSSTGVLRALETFSQLFFQHSKGPIYTKLAPVKVCDAPEYDHRGILMDVSRDWLPLETIYRTIDALSWSKMNRLHIHATDSQSWPLEIPSMPELHQKGAYANGKTYSPSDISAIQKYAIQRGVQAYIEVDSPGHLGVVALSHPDLITGWGASPWTTYCAEPPCGQLRLNEPKVDPFLDKLTDDLLPRLAPYSAYFHTGGDEVNFNEYNLDPTVGTNDSSVIGPLIQKFIDKHHARVRKAGLTPMVWEEIPANYNVSIGKDVVVQSWLGDEAIKSLTGNGHKVITSNYNYWYLDCGRGAWLNFEEGESFAENWPFNDWCGPTKSWRLIYSYDPRAGLTDEEAKLVIGGEVGAWAESIDEVNLDSILWPRSSAAGEVLWSGRLDAEGNNRTQIDAGPRLAEFRERLVARGVRADPIHMPKNLSRCFAVIMGLIETALGHVSFTSALIFISVGYTLWIVYNRVEQNVRLRRLGVRGTQIKSTLPFGLSLIKDQVLASINHTSYETYLQMVGNLPKFTGESNLLGLRVVMTADPENIKAVLATQFSEFGKGEEFHKGWSEFLGDSIFTTDGQQWHASRQLLRPQFLRERISDLHCFESHLDTLFKAIANGGVLNGENQEVDIEAGNGRPFDISDLFYRYTLDVATDFLLGLDIQSLTNPDEPFAEAFRKVQSIQNVRARAGILDPLVPKKVFRQQLKVINDLCNIYIDRTLQLSPEELASKTKADQGYTFLHELASFTRDRKVLRDQVIAVLLAGRDTTASALSFALYELARHPEIVHKMRQEIIDQVGLDRTPTYADLKSMKYLQNVINETLRLYPAVPFNVRHALADTTIPRGGGPDGAQPLPVLKGTAIAYSTLVMQRRADLYPAGSRPEAFDPERWFAWQPKPWYYIPFNGGPRICIGQQFALTEIGYVLTRLFQRYERVESFMREIDGGKPRLNAEVVIKPEDGVRVALWEVRREKGALI
ncbi:glycoside hydrolase family 20 protein [Daldinia bambusicola]|nr:glycoside hydrolase family 20 protein [Daldinia bambusicola]